MSRNATATNPSSLTCGFCSTDIPYGYTVCRGCQAEVIYGPQYVKATLFSIVGAVVGLFMGLLFSAIVLQAIQASFEYFGGAKGKALFHQHLPIYAGIGMVLLVLGLVIWLPIYLARQGWKHYATKEPRFIRVRRLR